MPDKADDSSSAGSRGLSMTRRGVLGLGVATVVLAAGRQLGAKTSSDASAQVANMGSMIEFSAGADGAPVLSSFRNAASHFEWATPAKAFAPTFKCCGS